MLLITYDLLLIEKFNIPCRRFFQLENFYEFHKIENPIDHLSISALGTLLLKVWNRSVVNLQNSARSKMSREKLLPSNSM